MPFTYYYKDGPVSPYSPYFEPPRPKEPVQRIVHRLDHNYVPKAIAAALLLRTGWVDTMAADVVAVPEPFGERQGKAKDGKVLVRMVASGVSYMDTLQRRGLLHRFRRQPFPQRMGIEGSGIVVKVGDGVTRFKPGDEVFGIAPNPGTHAEFAVFDENGLAKKPEEISHFRAAATPICGLLAYRALIKIGQVKPGDTVFVNGGFSECGPLAIQMAKALGANVVTTSDYRHLPTVKSCGPDTIIDVTNIWCTPDDAHRKFRYIQALEWFDTDADFDHPPVKVFIDAEGSDYEEKIWRGTAYKLAPGGHFFTIAPYNPGGPIENKLWRTLTHIKRSEWYDKIPKVLASWLKVPPSIIPASHHYHLAEPDKEAGIDLEEAGKFIAQHKITIPVTRIFRLSQVDKAHLISDRNPNGKVILDITEMGPW